MGVSAHAQLILTGRVWREEAPAQACYPTASRGRDVFCPTGPPGLKCRSTPLRSTEPGALLRHVLSWMENFTCHAYSPLALFSRINRNRRFRGKYG